MRKPFIATEDLTIEFWLRADHGGKYGACGGVFTLVTDISAPVADSEGEEGAGKLQADAGAYLSCRVNAESPAIPPSQSRVCVPDARARSASSRRSCSTALAMSPRNIRVCAGRNSSSPFGTHFPTRSARSAVPGVSRPRRRLYSQTFSRVFSGWWGSAVGWTTFACGERVAQGAT